MPPASLARIRGALTRKLGQHSFAGGTTTPKRMRSWKSRWLRSSALICVATSSFLLAAGLIVLRQSSLRTDGLKILSDNHYLWTYGPTALLVSLVAVWRQIDHEVEILAPWAALELGDSRAEDSIRLDYISPLLIVSAINALKKRHIFVSSSILGFVLLKLITLASTALLNVREVQLTSSSATIIRTSTFNADLFNESAFNGDTDSSTVYNAFGLSSYGLERADGVGDGLVYETFRTTSFPNPADTVLQADVVGLEPDFGCSLANVTINADPLGAQLTNASRGRVQIDSPACTFTGVEPTFLLDGSILESQVVPAVQRRGSMERVECTGFEPLGSNTNNFRLLVLAEIEYAQIFADSEIDGERNIGETANVTGWTAAVRRTSSIICNPQLKQAKYTVRYTSSQGLTAATLEGDPGSASFFERFTGDNLTSAFIASMLDAAGLFGVASASNGILLEDTPNTMFKMWRMSCSINEQR